MISKAARLLGKRSEAVNVSAFGNVSINRYGKGLISSDGAGSPTYHALRDKMAHVLITLVNLEVEPGDILLVWP